MTLLYFCLSARCIDVEIYCTCTLVTQRLKFVKVAATDMRYFARSKFSASLVHKKKLGLIWQVVFKLGYVFCQER